MNGYTVADRKQVGSFQELKDDGSTACGAWLYSGVFPKEDDNRARSRRPDGPEGPGTHLGLGLGLAGQSPQHVQPRLGRSRRQAVVRAQAAAALG